MEWIEANPLPPECVECQEEDCYNCDYAAGRWQLSRIDELRVRRKMMVRSINRMQRKLALIDKELNELQDDDNFAPESSQHANTINENTFIDSEKNCLFKRKLG